MQTTLQTYNARLMPKGNRYVLQVPRQILGFSYWKTIARYNTLEEFKSRYIKN